VGRAFRSLATVVLLAAAAPTAALSAETSVADTILEKAIASYRDGNLEPALGGINAALRGGLSSGLTARALYYRGLVYRKQGSPGHAISDLTRALDYDGLSEQERSDAMEARTAAYQEAGVADQEVVVIAPASGGGGKPPSQPPPQTTAAIVSPPATKPAAASWGGATQVAANAPLPVPTAGPPTVAAWSGTTKLDPPPQPTKPPAKQAEQSAPAPAPPKPTKEPAKQVEKPVPPPAPAKPWVTEAK
jgi:tetratricopeptide (TPR) repeat protein